MPRGERFIDEAAGDVLVVGASLHAIELIGLAEILDDVLDGLIPDLFWCSSSGWSGVEEILDFANILRHLG